MKQCCASKVVTLGCERKCAGLPSLTGTNVTLSLFLAKRFCKYCADFVVAKGGCSVGGGGKNSFRERTDRGVPLLSTDWKDVEMQSDSGMDTRDQRK